MVWNKKTRDKIRDALADRIEKKKIATAKKEAKAAKAKAMAKARATAKEAKHIAENIGEDAINELLKFVTPIMMINLPEMVEKRVGSVSPFPNLTEETPQVEDSDSCADIDIPELFENIDDNILDENLFEGFYQDTSK